MAHDGEAIAHVHSVGSLVWVEDDEDAWTAGEVTSLKGKEVIVKNGKGKELTVTGEHAYLQEPATMGGAEDMTRLSYLHEPGVLHNLRARYTLDEIYTYTGSILIAVNPFQRLPHLYNNHMMEQYEGVPLGELSPHVYAIAENAYRAMRNEQSNQSILVSGESGAGKTETCKLIMNYLAYMGGRATEGTRPVEQQVLESNPLLEAFGNAKTVRNDNSSRFGKFTEIQFDAKGRISGAAVRTYLLERSRVVSPNDPERNFHAFYQLCYGASEEDAAEWKLRAAHNFHYLNQSTCYELEGVDNAEEYQRTRRAMSVVGIEEEEQRGIFRLLAAILHLGNVAFKDGEEDDASAIDGEESHEHMTTAAELLGCPAEVLEKALLTRTISTHDGDIVKPLEPAAATNARDSLAKTLYARLFDFIVSRINSSIGQDSESTELIGVLDIYGFESFTQNDFEQFCINLANEKLQQHFNSHVFKQEQEVYTREEIDWSYIEFIDNQDVLDLIERKPGGVIDVLDEQCMFPKATHAEFAEKLYQMHGKGNPRFDKPKRSQTAFTLNHYAGSVTYSTENFLEKNRDYVVAEHEHLVESSSWAFFGAVFNAAAAAAAAAAPAGKGGNKGGGRKSSMKFSSVGGRFKTQLAELMKALNTTEPHYVRCIKPNSLNKPGIYDNASVLHQLRCGGVLEAIRISCAGYPSRREYEDFVDRFYMLNPSLLASEPDDRGVAKGILGATALEGWQLGKTMVFLRAGQMMMLDKIRSDVLGAAAIRIQRNVKMVQAKRRFHAWRAAAIRIQAHARALVARRVVQRMREERAAVTMQSRWRGFCVRRGWLKQRRAAVRLQAGARGFLARRRYLKLRKERATLVLQSWARGHAVRRVRLVARNAAVVFQSAWRRKKAVRELRRLRVEAKSVDKIRKDKEELEGKVAMLTEKLAEERQRAKEARAQLRAKEEELAASASALKEEAKAREDAVSALEASVGETRAARKDLEAHIEEMAERLQAKEKERAAAIDAVEGLKAELAEAKADADRRVAEAEEAAEASRKTLALEEDGRKEMMEEGKLMIAEAEEELAAAESGRKEAVLRAQLAEKESEELREKQRGMEEQVRNLSEELAKAQTAPAQFMDPGAVHGTKTPPHSSSSLQQAPQSPGSDAVTAVSDMAVAGMAKMSAGVRHMVAGVADTASSLHGLQPPAGERGPGRGKDGVEMQGPPGLRPPPGLAAEGALGEHDRQLQQLNRQRDQLLLTQVKADQDTLLRCLADEVGFSRGRPVAACLIFKCLLHWRTFEQERTNMFTSIINTMSATIEARQEDNVALAYWLSNTATLLSFLQRSLKQAGGSTAPRAQRRLTLLGRFHDRFMSPGSPQKAGGAAVAAAGGGGGAGGAAGEGARGGGADGAGGPVHQVEAKYPALLFKQQLTAFVEKIFMLLRDNVKKEITPVLGDCIQAPKGGRGGGGAKGAGRAGEGGRARGGAGKGGAEGGAGGSSSAAAAAAGGHWAQIVEVLDRLLHLFQANQVPRFLIQKLFTQVFSFINVQLFNSLLLRRECCSFSNGEYVKTGMSELENWIHRAGAEWMGSSWDELRYIRQAVNFLVIHQKPKKTLDEIQHDLCTVLSVQQLYRISTMYWDDKYGTETVSPQVLSNMKSLMVEDSSNASAPTNSFLLDDDSSIPFQVEQFITEIPTLDSLSDLPIPPPLRELPSFRFLSLEPAAAGGGG